MRSSRAGGESPDAVVRGKMRQRSWNVTRWGSSVVGVGWGREFRGKGAGGWGSPVLCGYWNVFFLILWVPHALAPSSSLPSPVVSGSSGSYSNAAQTSMLTAFLLTLYVSKTFPGLE